MILSLSLQSVRVLSMQMQEKTGDATEQMAIEPMAAERMKVEGPKNCPNPYVLRMNDFPGRLFPWDDAKVEAQALRSILQNYEEIFVELGSGSGGHIVSRALQQSVAAWVGFEIRYKRTVRTVEKAHRAKADNVYIVRTDGRVLEEFFKPRTISGLYINFPDPWERESRRKHRMLNFDTLKSAALVLRDKGLLCVKTDHQECFRKFLRDIERWNEECSEKGMFRIEWQTEDLHGGPYSEGNVTTEFERLFLSQSLPICGLRVSFRAPTSSSQSQVVSP